MTEQTPSPVRDSEPTAPSPLPRAAFTILVAYGLVGGALLAAGRGDYPDLHIILDTAMALLSGVLALALWDSGSHSESEIGKRLAIGFAATSAMELVHVLVTVEWSGALAPIVAAKQILRPQTWPPPSHLLPLAVIGALTWPVRGRRSLAGFALALALAAAGLFAAFHRLPTYWPPTVLGITRPALVVAPLLWAIAGALALGGARHDRVGRALPATSAVLLLANIVMLYSRAPADGPAMAAHLGKVAGDLILLLYLQQMGAQDLRERIRAEERLARLNEALDRRVLARTAELEAANQGLEREMHARRESQRLLDAVVENTPAVVYVKDLAGRYLMVNRRFADIFHVDGPAMAGRTDHDVFPKATADALRAMDARVAQAGRPITEEESVPQDDGLHAYISVKSPLRDDAGETYAIFGISTDITERKRAEESLAASEERTRRIVETALDAVVTMDSAGEITGWSAQAEKIFGWTRDEALGRTVEETIMPERYRDNHRQGLARYLATGEAAVLNKRTEVVALHRDGHEFPVELAITPIRMGEVVTFAGFVRDITDRKQAEAKLRTQLERLALLDEITRAIGHRQDVESIFQVVVRSIEEQLPADFACLCLYDDPERALTVAAVGANSLALALELAMPERARIDVGENGLSRCVRGQLVYEPEIAALDFPFPQRLARGGLGSLVAAPLQVESKVFGVLVVARFAAEGFVSGECEFLRQLSEHAALALHQAQLYGALQAAYDDLRQSQQIVLQQERLRALGQMASGVAHDINNALSPVALYTESILATEAGLSPVARGQLEIIQRAVEDVGQTISRMREFYTQREPDLIAAPVQVNDLVQQVLDLTKARWRDMAIQRGDVINTRTELEPNLSNVMGVEGEIRDALTNLVLNAVDALPGGGEIAIRTAAVGGAIRVEVSDNGVGMDAETRRRCLEPFFTTKGERGTGLGLATVYGMAQRHGADIDIASAPGQGTTVALVFRARNFEAADAPHPAAAGAAPKPMRLLLVDDDPVLLKALGDALTADGHAVTIANDGKGGIQAFGAAQENGGFDAVITDLGMPHVDGRQVAAAVKTRAPDTPVLLLTGWGRGLLAENDIPPHVDEVLGKPPKLREIRDALARLQGGQTP